MDNSNGPFYSNNQNNYNYDGYNYQGQNIAPYKRQGSVFIKRVLPVFLAVLLLGVGILLGFAIKGATISEEERLAKWLIETIDNNYLYPLTDAQKEYILGNMGKGAIYSLDPYSDFYTPSEMSEFSAQFDGEYTGIGFSYGQAKDANGIFTYISQVFENYDSAKPTPANKAGLKKYDRFVSLTYYTSNEGAQYVSKGTPGAVSHKVRFERNYSDGATDYASISDIYYAIENIPKDITFDLEIKRLNAGLTYDYIPLEELKKEVYNPGFVKYDNKATNPELSNDTAVVTLMSFMGNATEEIDNAMSKFKSEGKKNLILDLRNNGGGSINTLREIASYFITDSKKSNSLLVGYSLSKSGAKTSYRTIGNNKYYIPSGGKIIVLFNGSSASCTEALIGAMSDYDTLSYSVGTLSYGKGIRQGPYFFGAYCMYLTDGWMYWPLSNTCIDGVGIKPSAEIKDDYYGYYIPGNLGKDTQLNAAIAVAL